MASKKRQSPTEAKVWLLYGYTRRFPRVSRVVLREVCQYLGDYVILPILGKVLCYMSVYNLHSQSDRIHDLEEYMSGNWMFCLVGDKLVLGVLNRVAREIGIRVVQKKRKGANPKDKKPLIHEVKSVGTLNSAREIPGLGWSGEFIYAFGGNPHPHTLSSCEKYSLKTKSWTALRHHMNGRKYCFTPCMVHFEFYLCCATPDARPFEAFSPATETFRQLPASLSNSQPGCISFATSSTLYVLAPRCELVKLQLAKLEAGAEHLQYTVNWNTNATQSNIAPVRLGEKVCWVQAKTGKLVTYDLVTNAIYIPEPLPYDPDDSGPWN